jgi:hypothetical protein
MNADIQDWFTDEGALVWQVVRSYTATDLIERDCAEAFVQAFTRYRAFCAPPEDRENFQRLLEDDFALWLTEDEMLARAWWRSLYLAVGLASEERSDLEDSLVQAVLVRRGLAIYDEWMSVNEDERWEAFDGALIY